MVPVSHHILPVQLPELTVAQAMSAHVLLSQPMAVLSKPMRWENLA